jgi:hypothetical protein
MAFAERTIEDDVESSLSLAVEGDIQNRAGSRCWGAFSYLCPFRGAVFK